MSGHRIEVEPGVSIFAEDLGEGPPVVLIAGFGLSHPVWDSQVRQLTERGRRAVCVDLRGTGGSDKPLGGYDVERLALDVGAVIDRLDVRDAAIVGWSFGGQVAFRLAASAPDRFSRLVLFASNAVRASRGDGFPFGHPPDDLVPAMVDAERRDRVVARRDSILSGFNRPPDDQLLDWLVGVSLQMPSWAAVACYESMLRTDLSADLPAIQVPVLQLFGTEDPVLSGKGAAWLNEQLPDARIAEIPDSGHFPMFEASEAFDAALLEFVAPGAAK